MKRYLLLGLLLSSLLTLTAPVIVAAAPTAIAKAHPDRMRRTRLRLHRQAQLRVRQAKHNW